MHNLLALILAALFSDLVQCLTWALRWLAVWVRFAWRTVAPIAFFAFAAVLLITLSIGACNEAAQINSILNPKR